MIKSISIPALLMLICFSFSGCQDDDDIQISRSNKIYLLDRNNFNVYNVVSIDIETDEELIIGKLIRPEYVTLDVYDNTNSNLFIDLNREQLSASGWKDKSKYFLLFDYKTGNLIDSCKLKYPFTNRYFYSPTFENIYSYLSGVLFSIDLQDSLLITTSAAVNDSSECGVEHQGINNFDNELYNYGCDQTTIFNFETEQTVLIDHYKFDPNKMSDWILLYSVGLSKDHSYLLGFGSYYRHFPEDPDYIGPFDSIRNELFMVRKNLIDGSFSENQIDLNFGENNGYFNSEMEKYILKHNNQILLFNSDLTLYKTITTENMAIIKQ